YSPSAGRKTRRVSTVCRSQRERNWVVIRSFYPIVHLASAGSYRSADASPMNEVARFEQATRGGGWITRRCYCILKPCNRESKCRRIFGCVQVEISGNDHR